MHALVDDVYITIFSELVWCFSHNAKYFDIFFLWLSVRFAFNVQLHLQDLALGNFPLIRGYFCVRCLIQHKAPFWKHLAKPATFAGEKN